jgi:hypothetical protein
MPYNQVGSGPGMTFAGAMESAAPREPTLNEGRLALAVFVVALIFHGWAMSVGWTSRNLPANEFRESQTALSAYWIKADHDFSLAYPTPVVGKPWSVPMEFPLYQWTVVKVSDWTNWSLTKAGRAVSIACFYLGLPAVFLLLRRWRVATAWRWLVLAVVVTCPLYIYYARTLLIETMALMFSLWFWVAFERAVAERSRAWLTVAILAGTGAGLVKVTTFLLYLLPAGVWAATRLWRERARWKTEFAWMAAAVALPFAATLWWLRFADATKELNPLGRAFTSAGLHDFNFGTTATRFSGELWSTKAGIVSGQLTWWPVLALCAVAAVVAGRTRWREIAACVGCFATVLVFFPVLYAYHVYYYVANTVLLLVAMGLALVALAESRLPRWVAWGAVALVLLGQGGRYLAHYYPTQSLVLPGGDGLTTSLRTLTNPRDVIVVLGQDWNSMTPYYAQRRGVMIRDNIARDSAQVEQALALLDGEKLGALVIVGQPDGQQWLIDRAAARGLSREPLYLWHDARIYVPQARWAELTESVLDNRFPEVRLAPAVVVPQADLKAQWRDLASLRPWQRLHFEGMRPQPVRFFATFGPATDGSSGTLLYGAHPTTRLVFALPAGKHTLRATLEMTPDAWRLDTEHTDGVEVTLFALEGGAEKNVLATRNFNPRDNASDRGPGRPLEFNFTLPAAGEVELYFGPGPAKRDTRDWIQLGPLTIE